jgi:hypothetical protein
MAIFQAVGGYRDPAKSVTIKALENRLKAAQDAAAQSTKMTEPISNPWQGAGYLMNILGSQADEARAQSADISARDQLAKIKAGIDWNKGPDAQQYADMSRLDPEGADKIMQDWVNYRQDMEKQAKQNEFQTGERVGGQEFRTGERVAGETAAEAAAVAADQRAAAQKAADEQAKIDAIGKETEARKVEAEKMGLKPGTPEYDAYVLRNAAPPVDPLAGRAAMKDIKDMKLDAANYDSTLDNLNYAKELAVNAVSGSVNQAEVMTAMKAPGMGKAWLKARGYTDEQINATMQFSQIMGAETVQRMSATLKGQTSNYEMQHFTQIMNNPDSTPQQRLDAIQRMENAIKKDRSVISSSLFQYGDDPLPDYTYDRSRVVAPTSAAAPASGDATAAPAATDGAAAAAPADETPEQKEQRLRKFIKPKG